MGGSVRVLMKVVRLMVFSLLTLLITKGFAVELPEDIHGNVEMLSQKGSYLAEAGKYKDAETQFIEALNLLPQPIERWEACTWLLTAIGDVNFMQGAYKQAKDALSDAMHCPGAIGNPFIHLRLGQSQFELGNMDRALDELARAYMGAGKEIFENDDPKYFNYLKTVLKPPANEKW